MGLPGKARCEVIVGAATLEWGFHGGLNLLRFGVLFDHEGAQAPQLSVCSLILVTVAPTT